MLLTTQFLAGESSFKSFDCGFFRKFPSVGSHKHHSISRQKWLRMCKNMAEHSNVMLFILKFTFAGITAAPRLRWATEQP